MRAGEYTAETGAPDFFGDARPRTLHVVSGAKVVPYSDELRGRGGRSIRQKPLNRLHLVGWSASCAGSRVAF